MKRPEREHHCRHWPKGGGGVSMGITKQARTSTQDECDERIRMNECESSANPVVQASFWPTTTHFLAVLDDQVVVVVVVCLSRLCICSLLRVFPSSTICSIVVLVFVFFICLLPAPAHTSNQPKAIHKLYLVAWP